MAKVLIVEDDQNLLSTVIEWLEFEHYIVESASLGQDALDLLRSYKYDLIILDWTLPGTVSGIDICRAFRNKGGNTPILFLTGKGTMPDKETGFDAGADDYLTKPFHMKELSLRIRSLLRRSSGHVSDVLEAAHLRLDPKTYQVVSDGKEIHLARMEFAMLEFFMRNPKQVFSSDAILERVWSSASDRSPETLRTCLKKLRDKIDVEGRPSVIKNIHGVGYKFDPDTQ